MYNELLMDSHRDNNRATYVFLKPQDPSCPLCSSKNILHLTVIQSRTYQTCRECGLVFLGRRHRLGPEEERSRYLLHQNHPGDPDYRNFLGRLAEPLVKKLPRGADGLDYGSGPGPALSVILKEQGFSVRNYDPFFAPDPNVLEKTYDFITCTETVEHFFFPDWEFMKLNAMLKPGGWLAVMTGILGSDEVFPDWHYHRDPTHVCFFKKRTMTWIGGRFGWVVEHPRRNVVFFRKRAGIPPSAESPLPHPQRSLNSR